MGAPLGGTARRPARARLRRPAAAPRRGAPGRRPRRRGSCPTCCATCRPSTPEGEQLSGPVDEGAYGRFPLFETNADGVFSALQGRRLPAKRHPFGLWRRIEELAGDHVIDDGGDLWHRRVEEIDAIVCALCAHRYAVGHASWLGDPAEGVVVLPGASIPAEFSRQGVMPPVERLHLSRA